MYSNAIQPAMNHLRTTITFFPQLLDLSQIVILNLIARKEFIQLIDIDRRRSYSLTTYSLIHFIARKSDRNQDRKSTRLNSSHVAISYAVFCLKKKKQQQDRTFNNECLVDTAIYKAC